MLLLLRYVSVRWCIDVAVSWESFENWMNNWGNAAEWIGGVGTLIAAVIALIVYVRSRHEEVWSQASLIDVSRDSTHYWVHNRSEKPIIGVTMVPHRRGLWSAVRTGEYDGRVLFDGPTIIAFPSYEFYRHAKRVHRGSRNRPLVKRVMKWELKPGKKTSVDGGLVFRGGVAAAVEFRDIRGQRWSLDMHSKKLRRIRRETQIRKAVRTRAWALWWILKNEWTYPWRNYLYYPRGRPKRETSCRAIGHNRTDVR